MTLVQNRFTVQESNENQTWATFADARPMHGFPMAYNCYPEAVVIDSTSKSDYVHFGSYVSSQFIQPSTAITIDGIYLTSPDCFRDEGTTTIKGESYEVVSGLDKKIENLKIAYTREKTIVKDFIGNESTVFDNGMNSLITMMCSLQVPMVDLEIRNDTTVIFKLKIDASKKIIIRYHIDEPGRCTYNYLNGLASVDNGFGSLQSVILDVKKIISQVTFPRRVRSVWFKPR